MSDDPQTAGIEVTENMMEAGKAAFKAVAKRHGLSGLLYLGFISNAIASAYLAMERERSGLPRRDYW